MKYKIRIKKKRRRRRLYLFFILVLILLFLIILIIFPKKEPSAKEETPNPLIPPPAPSLKEDKYIIQKGWTLTDILTKHSFSSPEILELRKETKPIYDLAKIKAGHEIRILSDQDGKVKLVEYDIDEANYLLLKKDEGIFKAEIKGFPYEIKVSMLFGTIEDNLISAVNQQNEEDYLALSLAELFAWDIDFYTDLRRGDNFKIIYEKKYLNNKFAGYRNIIAAEFTNQGNPFQAFRYTYSDTKEVDYFSPDGNSLRKEFLKSPIKFGRITSRFSLNRLHPIRKVYRPHYGVDYAAIPGTPVQATADGKVTFVGWNGASGRMVRIRHKNTYETMYLHLRRFAKGIRKGAKVKGGQIIGFVGSSGESTGPHLDYRIKYKGKYINPFAWRFKPVSPLRPEFLEDFKKNIKKYCLAFETLQVIFSKTSSFI
ncbi:MAG: M23 family metallopeptidase [Candidatus Aminicenantaceae bacterium]